jgi:hypothetical protein
MSSSCKKQKEICQWSYFTFEHPVSVYPTKESYNIGDTIWFEMNFSDVFNVNVKNNINGSTRNETVQLKNFDFHRIFLRILKLVDSSQNINGQPTGTWSKSFEPIYTTGQLLGELPDGPEYKLKYENNSYRLKFGTILQQSGVFLFYPKFKHYYPNANKSLNVVKIRTECDGKDQIEDIKFPVNRQNDGTHKTNYHLFELYMNPTLENKNDLESFKNECFTFVVK